MKFLCCVVATLWKLNAKMFFCLYTPISPVYKLFVQLHRGVSGKVSVNSCFPWFHRACYGVLRFIMESGAKGCEVVVSGKLRGQRAKSMKFVDGLMIHSGEPTNDYVDTATRHVLLRQGMYYIIATFRPLD